MSDNLCKAKVGLLFLRDCDRPVFDSCTTCNRPVCKQHRIKSGGGTLCPECASEKKKFRNDDRVSRSRHRSGYYDRYGYLPYYYGRDRYYSDRDYRTFDSDRDRDQDVAGQAQDQDQDQDYDDNDDDAAAFAASDSFMES